MSVPSPRPERRSPWRSLAIGLAVAVCTIAGIGGYTISEIHRLRDEQTLVSDRNRKDSLQLLRIQNNLASLAVLMRDMVEGTEPYPLYGWQPAFDRVRRDLTEAARLEQGLAAADEDAVRCPRNSRRPQQEYAKKLREWRTAVSIEPFKKLRQMYNDAGVSIYAWKQLNPNVSDEEVEYVFKVVEVLGCTHTTVELPTNPSQLKRFGDFATKHKVHVAYHTHLQGNMTAFDQAFAASPGNMANVDFGHWVAAGNIGGTPMDFLRKHHDRISSFHLKDRTTPEHCALNLPFGKGETPIREILQLLSTNRWKIPATIELEYEIPEGSDAVKEVQKCVEYCRRVLTS